MAGEAIKIMEDCAAAVDAGPENGKPSWQFFGAHGNFKKNEYVIKFLSKGGMPLIMPDDFGYLGDFVAVDSPDTDRTLAPRMVTYEGPAEHIPDFTTVMRDKLILPVDDEDPLEGFNGPLTLMSVLLGSAMNENGEYDG